MKELTVLWVVLTLHLEVEQDSKELQKHLSEGQVSKRAGGRDAWGGQAATYALLSSEESIH